MNYFFLQTQLLLFFPDSEMEGKADPGGCTVTFTELSTGISREKNKLNENLSVDVHCG
jgi:hypothetical protein